MEFGEQLGHVIRQFGSYRSLVERMNTIDKAEVILDPAFSSFDPSEAMQGSESRSLVEARSAEAFRLFEDLLNAIAEFNASYSPTPNKSKGRRLARSAINVSQQFVDVIHTCATDILALLAQVCLLNRTIAAHADEYGALPPIHLAPTSTQEEDVFHYLAGHSSSRNSFAVANFLRAEHIKLERMFAHCYELESGNEIVWLRELLSRKSIKWLMELNELTSKDSLA
jgi:hypothetical protein